MQLLKSLVCLGLMLTLVSGANADEATARKKKGEKKAPSATHRIVGKMELTDAQKEQIAAIDKEFAEQLIALTKAESDILTDEQQKAKKEATQANKTAGKQGPEARKAVEEALKLTEEQKAKLKEHKKAQDEFNGKVIEALKKVLTPEQQESLPKPREEKTKKKKDA